MKNISSAGSVIGAGEYEENANVTIRAVTFGGYTFLGWFDDSKLLTTESEYSFVMGKNDLVYVAKWAVDDTQQTFTVTFNSNGGSEVQSQSVVNGGKIIEPTAPTKNGQTFSHWEYNGERWSFGGYIVNSNMTLDAVWESILKGNITYKLCIDDFNSRDTFILENDRRITYYEDSLDSPLPKPNRLGYAFGGWYKDRFYRNEFTDLHELNGDITLYAKWIDLSNEVTEPLFSGVFTFDEESVAYRKSLVIDYENVYADQTNYSIGTIPRDNTSVNLVFNRVADDPDSFYYDYIGHNYLSSPSFRACIAAIVQEEFANYYGDNMKKTYTISEGANYKLIGDDELISNYKETKELSANIKNSRSAALENKDEIFKMLASFSDDYSKPIKVGSDKTDVKNALNKVAKYFNDATGKTLTFTYETYDYEGEYDIVFLKNDVSSVNDKDAYRLICNAYESSIFDFHANHNGGVSCRYMDTGSGMISTRFMNERIANSYLFEEGKLATVEVSVNYGDNGVSGTVKLPKAIADKYTKVRMMMYSYYGDDPYDTLVGSTPDDDNEGYTIDKSTYSFNFEYSYDEVNYMYNHFIEKGSYDYLTSHYSNYEGLSLEEMIYTLDSICLEPNLPLDNPYEGPYFQIIYGYINFGSISKDLIYKNI